MTERASNVDHDTDNQPGEFVDTPENEPGDQAEPQSPSATEEELPKP